MRNITVAVDDQTYTRARVRAAQRGASVSALVRGFLNDLAETETVFDRLKREEAELREQISRFDASDRVDRDALHDRRG